MSFKSKFADYAPTVAAAAAVLACPLDGELVFAAPRVLAAFLCAAFGAWALFFDEDRPRIQAGFVALLCAAALAPLHAWPFAALPLFRRDMRGRSLALSGALFCACAVAGLLAGDRAALDDLREDFGGKYVEAVGSAFAAAKAAFVPWRTPVVPCGRFDDALPGIALLVATLAAFAAIFARGARHRWTAAALLGLLALWSPVLPALFGRPLGSSGALAAWCLAAVVVYGSFRMGEVLLRGRTRVVAAAAWAVIVVASIGSGASRSSALWTTWSDPGGAWDAAFAERPAASAYRFEHAEFIRRRGDESAARRDAEAYFASSDASPSKRRTYMLGLLDRGEDDAAAAQLRRLDPSKLGLDEAATRRLLDLCSKRADWTLLFAVGEASADRLPGLRLPLAQAAVKAKRTDAFERYIAAALDAPNPPVEAFELRYRDLRNKQDRAGLKALGARAIELHPDAAVGYAALGKAAKLVREDDEMIRRFDEALARNPELSDLHYDLGLVLHGRKGAEALAARHYRRVLELEPEHPRRTTIEGWIASLETAAGESPK